MSKILKKDIILKIKNDIKKYKTIYIVNINNLNALDISMIRSYCYKFDIIFKVAKNTLIKKSLDQSSSYYNTIDSVLHESSGMIFSNHNSKKIANMLNNININNNINIIVKGAIIEDILYVNCSINELSKIKSQKDLLMDIINGLNNQFSTIMANIQSNNKILTLLKILEKK
ncbi:MAG: 50S ribosomal protein L10 [Bacteroides sp.]|nr:MAG: 50S ribosomal protein L10 [Bacteroides sp.]